MTAQPLSAVKQALLAGVRRGLQLGVWVVYTAGSNWLF